MSLTLCSCCINSFVSQLHDVYNPYIYLKTFYYSYETPTEMDGVYIKMSYYSSSSFILIINSSYSFLSVFDVMLYIFLFGNSYFIFSHILKAPYNDVVAIIVYSLFFISLYIFNKMFYVSQNVTL